MQHWQHCVEIHALIMSLKKSCKICNKSAKTNVVKCVNCESDLHKTCCLKKNLEILDEQVKCCDEINESLEVTVMENTDCYEIEQLRKEIQYLKVLIREKNKTIMDKCIIIKDKEAIINLLQQDNTNTISTYTEDTEKSKKFVLGSTATLEASTRGQPGVKRTVNQQITPQKVNTNSSKPKHKQFEENDDEWQLVGSKTTVKQKPRQNKKASGIVGSGNIEGVSAVSKKSVLFVSRLSAQTQIEVLQKHVRNHFPEATCSALDSKYPEHYSSFKITVDASHFEAAMDPAVWPAGAYISKFFQKRNILQQKG